MKKYDHSPLDTAVFAVLNSSIFGICYALSMLNKEFEPSKFNYLKKMGLVGRSVAVISSVHGLNQYFSKFFSLKDTQTYMRNKLNMKNEKQRK